MRIIIMGATGMAGSEVVRQAIADANISAITTITRKKIDIQHPKLISLVHENFLDYSSLSDVFKNNDACIWCLGISQNLVTKEQYIIITYDYTLV